MDTTKQKSVDVTAKPHKASRNASIDQTHDGLRIIIRDASLPFVRTAFLAVLVVAVAAYYLTWGTEAVFIFAVTALCGLSIGGVLLYSYLATEQLEISLANVVIRKNFYHRVLSLGTVRDFCAVHNIARSEKTGWALVFSADGVDYSICRDIDYDSAAQICWLVGRYFPTIAQPLEVSRLGTDQMKNRQICSQAIDLGTRYWKPISGSSTLSAVLIISAIIFIAYGTISKMPGPPSWERLWQVFEQIAIYLVKTTAVLIPIVISIFKRKYIEVTSSLLVLGERPFGKREEYPFTDVGDIRPADWSITQQFTPQCAIELVIGGVVVRMFEGISRQEAAVLAEELRSAIGLRRGYGKLGAR